MSIEELEHTADLRFRVCAPTLEALFAEAVRALMETLYGDTGGPVIETRTIEVSAADRETLLHDFLSEVLFLAEAENLVFPDVEPAIADGPPLSIRATLRATPFDPARHAGGTEVKGIAYFDLSIVEAAGGFCLEIVFDV
jgi:SHS2 domain-containing protein